MDWKESTRRSFLKLFGAAGATALTAANSGALGLTGAQAQSATAQAPKSPSELKQAATRAERMKWFREAKFGMKIHWGLYSVIGQREWAKELAGIPLPEYEQLARHFHPKPNAAREWARLAKRAGQKYIVLTAKHHEGFCMWDSKLTDYNAARQGPGRDLVREFVEAARAEGLRVGLYYSLMDWHHPDGAICKTDEAARKRFVEYTHGLIRELMTNYGKIDVLWYDVHWPLDAAGWESVRMNEMVFDLQPEIIVNHRNALEGDYTALDHMDKGLETAQAGGYWENTATINDSFGFHRNDDAWKSPKTIVDDLVTCARDGGNYLLNIGADENGSIPPPAREAMEAVGTWMVTNGKAIYGTELGRFTPNQANYTRRGNTLYIHQRFWPGHTPVADWMSFYQPEVVMAIGGMKTKVLSARLLKTGQKVEFTQDEFTFRMTGLPLEAPDELATVIEVECDGEPVIDHRLMRPLWPRHNVGMSA